MAELDFKPLKLLAKDEEELQILSACLQDGLMPLTSFHFDKEKKTFTALVNRFCWEHLDDYEQHKTFYRVHTGLVFFNVECIHQRGFTQKHPQRVFSLLSMSINKEENNNLTIHLLFSGDHEIRLEITSLNCRVADVDHPWSTTKRPMHLHEHLEELNLKSA